MRKSIRTMIAKSVIERLKKRYSKNYIFNSVTSDQGGIFRYKVNRTENGIVGNPNDAVIWFSRVSMNIFTKESQYRRA